MDLALEYQISRLKAGHQEAFDLIYQMTYKKIFYIVLPILRDKALTEDIMQDTYLKFLEKLYEYKSKNSLAYILTIAKNLAINTYNKRKKELMLDDLSMNNFSVLDYVEIRESNKEMITEALSLLSDSEKNVFLLHTVENLKHREISVILDIPLGTVTWTYQQAIKKMRGHLKG